MTFIRQINLVSYIASLSEIDCNEKPTCHSIDVIANSSHFMQ